MKKKKIEKIIITLKEFYKGFEINWSENLTPFQILIGTIISQRTRDIMTEKITKRLFKKYKTPKDFANAKLKEIENLIKGAGFYKQKAKRIKELSKIILKKYKGKIPKKREELLKLPGVGPKTSGIVVVYGFGENNAIPVDVHVHRISNRISIVKTKTPEETEKELMKVVPKKYWKILNHLFVIHGQNICLPRNPKCNKCPIKIYCNYYKTFFSTNL